MLQKLGRFINKEILQSFNKRSRFLKARLTFGNWLPIGPSKKCFMTISFFEICSFFRQLSGHTSPIFVNPIFVKRQYVLSQQPKLKVLSKTDTFFTKKKFLRTFITLTSSHTIESQQFFQYLHLSTVGVNFTNNFVEAQLDKK